MRYLILIGLLVALPLAAARAENGPTVVLSEIGWAGSSLSTADEFVELVNLADAPTDLSGYRLGGGGDILLPPGTTVPARGTFVIANFPADDPRSALLHADLVTSALSLANAALSLTLEAPDGTIVDRAGDGGAPLAGRTSSNGSGAASMSRASPIADGTLASSWHATETASGLDPGLPDLGTPGTHEPPETDGTAPVADPDPVPTTEPDPPTDPEPPMEEPVVTDESPVPVIEEPVPDSPAESPSIPAAPTDARIVFPPRTLEISELYPVPASGEDEFVEVLNPFNAVIPLAGWTLRDASLAKTPLPDQLLGYGQRIVLRNPKGRLNNDGDTLELLAPDGSVNDAAAYGKDGQKAGLAFVRTDDGLALTTQPTPGEANVLAPPGAPPSANEEAPADAPSSPIVPASPPAPVPSPPEPTPSYAPPPVPDRPSDEGIRPPPVVPARAQPVVVPAAVAAAKPAKPVAKPAAKKPAARAAARVARVTVAEARALAANRRLRMEAVVTAAPGALGKQLMAVADATGGITVFKSDGKFPALSPGDRVDIVGVASASRGMARVRLDAASSVAVIGASEAPVPRDAEEAGEDDVGALIRVTGLLTKDAVETAGGMVAIRLPAGTTAKPGARVEATGVLVATDGALKLLPRSAGDLRVLVPAPEPAAALSTKADGRKGSGMLITGLTLAAVAAFALRPHVQSFIDRYAKRPALAVPAQAAD